jgi:acetate kinase
VPDRYLLVLNAGSSSLKHELLDDGERSVARGEVGRVGAERARQVLTIEGRTAGTERACLDHAAALDWALGELGNALAGWERRVTAVGHRIVHGGPRLWLPTRVDDAVVDELEHQAELAPLHNGPSLATLRAARALLPDVPHVAVFDTGFHHDLPAVARAYALPAELVERFQIRRYGFHGTSCRYVLTRAAELGVEPRARAIVCHLGAGASVTAALDGRSVDTSMGFTPLEGLVMGTRSGDLDPALPLFLQRHAGLDAAGVGRLLERESGLRGLGGRSGDYAELERLAADGDARADLALEVFADRVRKYLGAYWATLGGVDLVVFTGGIGERSADARRRILAPMAELGWRLDPERNAAGANERAVSPEGQRLTIWVIPTRETLQIAREVRAAVDART